MGSTLRLPGSFLPAVCLCTTFTLLLSECPNRTHCASRTLRPR
ncbi:Uncharacterised protein [Bordetella pertussis]|nr:Uncharacterised protein [Bordetella pertussis]